MNDRILIAGIGNIFLGDDAFGVEVARALGRDPLPPEVTVVDYGIRGLDLVYALLEPWCAVVLVDAVRRGELPGTLYLLEPEMPEAPAAVPQIDSHAMDPLKVLEMAALLDAPHSPLYLVGCEPELPRLTEEEQPSTLEMIDGLSPAVARAVPHAVERIRSLVNQLYPNESLVA